MSSSPPGLGANPPLGIDPMRTASAFFFLFLSLSGGPLAIAGTDDNVGAARRVFTEGVATGNFDRGIYTRDFVAHAASANYNLEQDLAASGSWHLAMPDLKVVVERTVADRDMVAVHWQVVGTNTVAAGGMPGKGDRIGIEGMTFFRFVRGKIAEEWTVLDIATLRKDLGQ
jgi:steroid delta-isomerase-like uncharacterized protein